MAFLQKEFALNGGFLHKKGYIFKPNRIHISLLSNQWGRDIDITGNPQITITTEPKISIANQDSS